MNNQEFVSSVQIDGNMFAFIPDLTDVTIGEEYPIIFTSCAISAQAAVTIAAGNIYYVLNIHRDSNSFCSIC